MTDLAGPLGRVAATWRPRILTQLCRDPTSPFFGCADRNWWHYKIRDFPSVILQQAGYAMHLAGQFAGAESERTALDNLAAGAARFWNARALKHGAFEEYYPFEQGYPPLAFSTLAMAKLAYRGVIEVNAIAPGLRVAARQLRSRFEGQAANQQVAGLAALAWIDKLLPAEADDATFSTLKARTLALLTAEGWFWEYDGPDLGYLAVTLDCLWDLVDATGDSDYRTAISRATAFMAQVYAALPGGAGQLNARNTDYLAPYGLIRAAAEEDAAAAAVAQAAFATADHPEHAFAAVDDRYLCHYLGQSVMRACLVPSGAGAERAVAAAALPTFLPQAGYYLAADYAVAGRKGGIVLLPTGQGDFGWIVQRGKRQFVSHWWSPSWRVSLDGDVVRISGALFAHRERVSTPARHVVLRTLSFVLGRHLIALLKRVLIFKRAGEEITFERAISPAAGGCRIVDRFTGLQPTDRLMRAPRASKRHVASADSYHRQDLTGYGIEDAPGELTGGQIEIVTILPPQASSSAP